MLFSFYTQMITPKLHISQMSLVISLLYGDQFRGKKSSIYLVFTLLPTYSFVKFAGENHLLFVALYEMGAYLSNYHQREENDTRCTALLSKMIF